MIDKDIEEITGNINSTLVQKIDNVFTTLLENRNIFPKEFIESLMYVLDMLVNKQLKPSELTVCETLVEKSKYEMQRLKDEHYEKRIEFLSKELETYKKIDELKTQEIYRLFYIVSREVGYYQADDYSDGEDTTIEEIKEYFRKEVEKDVR